ncbi:nuclear mRNA export, poly(A)+RNA binding protein [Arthrobotrys conoides]|uniref:mRNA export factor MEX67 n=1 Tax=Arthrobotrys conoides TaxID=74498 RepID=A0AAN8NC59_9PEZI
MTGRSSLPANLGRNRTGGGIQKRRQSARLDREGDLDMGGQAPTGPRARPISGAKPRPTRSNTAPGQKPEAGPSKGFRPVRSNARHPVGTVNGIKQPAGGFIEMKVSGWKELKVTNSETIVFLERRLKEKLRRVRPVGDNIMFQVPLVKVPTILEFDNIKFAGGNLRIQPVNELPASIQAAIKPTVDRSEEAQQLATLLKNVLQSRYIATSKMLDLSALGTHPQLQGSGFFDQDSTRAKMFPAMMKVADEQFTNRAEKRDSVVSVNLASNTLNDISMVASLAATFPELKNLSLENNNITTFKQLEPWRFKFRKLEQLLLTGNPITQLPNYREDCRKWWKSLVMLDNEYYPDPPPALRNDTAAGPGPFPPMPLMIQPSGVIEDQDHTNEFLSTFFPAFDTDRQLCVQTFYNHQSMFSISVNVSAPRLSGDTKHNIQKWDAYIPKSRNMVRLRNPTAIKDRCAKGPTAILKIWNTLPRTFHDVTDPLKWNYDSRNISYEDTVGMLLTVHGEYEEPENVAMEGIASKRSFTRTILVLPNGAGGYLVRRDMLLVRAYGGSSAWQAATLMPQPPPPPQPQPQPVVAQVTEQAAVQPVADPKEQMLQMIQQLISQTGLTPKFAEMCLEQTGWDLTKAMHAFNKVRASGSLPPDALAQPVV